MQNDVQHCQLWHVTAGLWISPRASSKQAADRLHAAAGTCSRCVTRSRHRPTAAGAIIVQDDDWFDSFCCWHACCTVSAPERRQRREGVPATPAHLVQTLDSVLVRRLGDSELLMYATSRFPPTVAEHLTFGTTGLATELHMEELLIWAFCMWFSPKPLSKFPPPQHNLKRAWHFCQTLTAGGW